MKIGEIIKKYRKEVNLTQEQLANYLGVTAPAVNKWENGNSYPDITLLSPLARLLKIDVDTLLSFHEDLSEIEINSYITELTLMIQNDGYDAAFKKGEELIKEFPCCDKMILSTAQILKVYLTLQEIKESERYETKINQWYEIVINSEDPEIVATATVSLVAQYAEKEEYESAQQLLDKIPPLGYDKRQIQAMLYFRQGKDEEAYKLYEEQMLQTANNLNQVLQLIIGRMIKEEQFDQLPRYVNAAKQVAVLFDLGAYIENTPDFFVAIAKQDAEGTIAALQNMIHGIDIRSDFSKSELYSHMKFQPSSDGKLVKDMIKKGLLTDEKLNFIKEDHRYQSLVKELDTTNR